MDSLLTRARCYGQLGQKKTAMFDFNAILKEDPENAQALSGRGFIHLALNQKKVVSLGAFFHCNSLRLFMFRTIQDIPSSTQ